MEAAKHAVSDFMSKSGKHDTSVHQNTAPAVTNETVNTHRHENVTTAVDREIHQDHYHTTVQPVHDTHTKPETHHHNLVPIEHRKHEHGNDDEVRRRLETEKAKFQDSSVKGETKHTSTAHPTIEGEHVHHHVHENIQPVINRQTIEPHVVHTTVPIHETHHSAAKHHATSALPAVSMADFKKQGGALGGREHESQFFQGEPRGIHGHEPHNGRGSDEFRRTGHVDQHGLGGSQTGTTGSSALTGDHHNHSKGTGLAAGAATGAAVAGAEKHHHDHSGASGDHSSHSKGTGLAAGATTGAAVTGAEKHHHDHSTGTGSGLTSGSSTTGGHHNTTGTGLTNGGSTTGTHDHASGLTGNGANYASQSKHTGTDGAIGNTSSTGTTGHDTTDASGTTKKPSLLSRINPLKDADGDGKKGFMD